MIRRLASRTVYENQWMRVREDDIERVDGSKGVYGVVEKPDFALVVPKADGGLWLVEQFRYPVGERLWEFPQGSWEHDPSVDPELLARAELEEETGLRAGRLRHLGYLYEASGYSTQGFNVWVADELVPGRFRRTIEEQDMHVRHVADDEWVAMVKSGAVKDAPSIAAYGLLLLDLVG